MNLRILLPLATLFVAGAASPSKFAQMPDGLCELTCKPQFNDAGKCATFVLKAGFSHALVNVDNPMDRTQRQSGSVEIDLLKPGKSVLLNGELVTYREISDALTAIAWSEWGLVNSQALAQRRRQLREPVTSDSQPANR